MRQVLLGLAIIAASAPLLADEAQDCKNAGGSLVTGVVVDGPYFTGGKDVLDPKDKIKIELSHTHLILKSDQDGKRYDVAIDNVFASGYDPVSTEKVPAPFDSIADGDHLELCGHLYTHGPLGMHMVHPGCADTPSYDQPNGWVKKIQGGKVGPNLAGETRYCEIWDGKSR